MKTLLQIGFGRKDFTPDAPVGMNSRCVGTNVVAPIFVTCVAWKDENETVLTISVDLRNMYDVFQIPVRRAVSELTGIPFDHVMLAGTHNHSCPDISSFRRVGVQDWYDRIGLPAICEAAREALADLTPVTGAIGGKSIAEKVAFVRRFRRADGTWRTIGCRPNDSPVVADESRADPELRAVRFQREGKKDVILVNFQTHAAHALARFNDRVCADFVGNLRDTLEKAENALVVYFQGACGDVNTFARLPEDKEGWVDSYDEVGRILAVAAQKALQNGSPLKLGPLHYVPTTLTCTVNHKKTHLAPKVDEIYAESDPNKVPELMERYGFQNRYELWAIKERSAFGEERDMPLSVFAMGDFAMGITPVELFCSCGKAFRDISPYPITFFVGYANGEHNYMASAPAFPHEGYEVLEAHYVGGTGEMIALKLGAELNRLYREDQKKEN